jgi:predicted nucleic acid-binding protein
MPDRAFFDTNILLYAVAQNDLRHESALELLGAGGIVSVQILNEFVSVVRRKVQMPWQDIRAALGWIRLLCPNPVSLSIRTHEEAVRIAARYGYQIYDSAVVASALESECNILYSEDLQNGQVIEGKLTVQNPFDPWCE